MSAWLWLAALALLLVSLLVFALSSPIEVHVVAAYPARTPVEADVRWLHGLLEIEGLGPSPGDAEAEEEIGAEPDAEEAREPERPLEPEEETDEDEGPLDRVEAALDTGVGYLETRSKARTRARMALAAFQTEDFTLEVTRMLRDLVGAVDVDRVGIQAGFGFGSPAQTGKVYGQLQAAFAWTHATPGIHVEIHPDFHQPGFEAGGDVALEARTWDLLRPLIVFAFAGPTWRAVKNARSARHG